MEADIFFYLLLLFATAVYGLLNFNRLSVENRLLTIFILSAFLSELTARFLAALVKNSCPPYHVFCILNYWFFAGIYLTLFTSQKTRWLIKLSGLLFTVIAIFNTIFVQPLSEIPLFNIIISNLLFIWMSLTLFLQMLDQPVQSSLFRQSIFWLNIAILIYAVIMPICIGLLAYMITNRKYSEIVMNFNEFITCLYYSILGYAIFIDRKSLEIQ